MIFRATSGETPEANAVSNTSVNVFVNKPGDIFKTNKDIFKVNKDIFKVKDNILKVKGIELNGDIFVPSDEAPEGTGDFSKAESLFDSDSAH